MLVPYLFRKDQNYIICQWYMCRVFNLEKPGSGCGDCLLWERLQLKDIYQNAFLKERSVVKDPLILVEESEI